MNGSLFSTSPSPTSIKFPVGSSSQVQLVLTLPAICTRTTTQQITFNNFLSPIASEIALCGLAPVPIGVVGTPGVQHRWSPPDGLSDTTVGNPIFTPFTSNPQEYPIRKVLRRTTANGICSSTDTVFIRWLSPPPGAGIALEQVSTLEQNESDVALRWRYNGPLPDSIRILRTTLSTSEERSFSVSNASTTFTQFGLDTDSTSYRYAVRGFYVCGSSPLPAASETILLRSLAGGDTTALVWNPYKGWSSGVLRYEIWRGSVGSQSMNRMATTSDTLWRIAQDGSSSFQAYRIRALRADQAAFSWSNIVEAGTSSTFLIPNVIAANGDGQNDTFFIGGIAGFGNVALEVLNRFGRKVYDEPSYQNNWDGVGLPSGVYYYILKCSSPDVTYKGWVHLLR